MIGSLECNIYVDQLLYYSKGNLNDSMTADSSATCRGINWGIDRLVLNIWVMVWVRANLSLQNLGGDGVDLICHALILEPFLSISTQDISLFQ